MTTRNFIQQGQAYGETTCTITANLDGATIYSGSAPTEDSPLPPLPGAIIDTDVFSWQLPTDFQGTKTLVITVANAPFVLSDTLADRTDVANINAFESSQFTQTIANIIVTDPLTNVTIDGVAATRGTDSTGQWYWLILPDQTFQATLNITAGVDCPNWDPAVSYPTYSDVMYNNIPYSNGKTPAGPGLAPDTNPAVWYTLPIAFWNNTTPYDQYDRVKDGPSVYMAVQSVPAGVATSDTNYWELRGTSV